jgi:WhiB family redox-sensing transcriptional regulator
MSNRRETPTAPGYPPVALKPDRACNGVDPEIFYPRTATVPDLDDYANFTLVIEREDAKTICKRCPHQRECLNWALATRQAFGIWAGTTPAERDRILETRATA